MGGNISVSSEVGKGSVFTFNVEIKEGSSEIFEQNPAKRVISLVKNQKKHLVMVVDDNIENLQIVVMLLKMVGFETLEATNGKDAIEKFEQWSPDLILMDLRMPVMDGYEATRHIKLTDKGIHTPVIAITANILEEDRNRIETIGIQGFIVEFALVFGVYTSSNIPDAPADKTAPFCIVNTPESGSNPTT